MSLVRVKDILEEANKSKIWNLYLLTIEKIEGEVCYSAQSIQIRDEKGIKGIAGEIIDLYLKKKLDVFSNIEQYNGNPIKQDICKLEINDTLINDDIKKLNEATVNANKEGNPLDIKASAYILEGIIKNSNIKIISVQNPIVTMKNKFGLNKRTFEIIDKVLYLKQTIDVIITDDMIYMLSDNAERLFNFEKSYKKVSKGKIELIKNLHIITNEENFEIYASKGFNPRKFLAFNDNYLEKLKDKKIRKKIAGKFDIQIDKGKFVTDNAEQVDKIVKVLCSKGMLDPFDQVPMEVFGSRKWK